MVTDIIAVIATFVTGAFVLIFLARTYFERKRRANRLGPERTTVAFFHPYCNAGGGGEKVLWCGIAALQEKYPDIDIFIYTGDTDATDEQILTKACQRFNIQLQRPVHFVYLKWRCLVEAKMYPVFTLLGQSVGGLLLGLVALLKFCPDVFVESTGFAFPMPMFRYVAKCRVACYTHYPTISVDMLQLVAERRPTYNNRNTVASNPVLSTAKLIYYKIFAWIYGLAGSASLIVMVNSTWTYQHIRTIWKRTDAVIVYPPCDVDEFMTISGTESESNLDMEIRVLTVGQFRPEKDHRKQVEIVKYLKDTLAQEQWRKLKWVLVGGCRHEDDYKLVEDVKKTAAEFEVEEKLEFKINASFNDLKIELGRALIGVHTMWNEHFGIGIVEHMAAGNVMVAHNSGGPKSDIVVPYEKEEVGFLADTVESYGTTIKRIIEMTTDQRNRIRNAARSSVKERFDQSRFAEGFSDAIGSLL